MGCGESKHDIATGNTITRNKSSKSGFKKKSKDIEAIVETSTEGNNNNANSLVQQQESENVSRVSGVDDVIKVVADVKDITENTELLKGGDNDKLQLNKEKESGGGVEEEEKGRLITLDSPNHFFSSRKDEDGVAYEGTEKSEYGTPRHTSSKESMLNENVMTTDDDVKEKEMVEETKPEAENGEAEEVKEENYVRKEAEVETTLEADQTVNIPIKEEKVTKVDGKGDLEELTKDLLVQEDLAHDSVPTKDLKTN